MQKGPKPRTKLLHLPGTPRNMRFTVPVDEVEESPQIKPAEKTEPPAWLDADAREIFATKAAQIRAAGYWAERFEDSLALLATLLAEHRRNPDGLSAARLTQLRLLLSELALTPASSRAVAPAPGR